VRCLVRRPERAGRLREIGCEIVSGDMADAVGLASAAEDCDAVVHLVAIIAGRREQFERIMEHGTRDLVAAAKAAGVRRFLLMSALGTTDATRELVPYFHAKWEEERAVADSGIPYVTFRPSFVFGPDGGILPSFLRMARYSPVMPLPGSGRQQIQPIWVDDVAAYFAKALGLEAAANRTFELGGPDQVTWDELFQRLRRTLHRRGTTIHVPTALLRPQAALLERLPRPPLTRDMLTMLEAGDNVTSSADAVETFGLPLVTLDEQLRRAAARK